MKEYEVSNVETNDANIEKRKDIKKLIDDLDKNVYS